MTPKDSCVVCGWSLTAHVPGTKESKSATGVCQRFRVVHEPYLAAKPSQGGPPSNGWSAVDPHEGALWLISSMDDPDWTVAYRLLPQDRELVVAEMRMYPTDPPGYLVEEPGEWSGHVSSVPGGGLAARKARPRIDEARRIANRLIHELQAKEPDAFAEEGPLGIRGIDEDLVETLAIPRSGRSLPDSTYALCAYVYLQAVDGEFGEGPPIDLAAKVLEISNTTLRGRLDTARSRGLVTRPPRRGVSGGALTSKGWDALESARREAE